MMCETCSFQPQLPFHMLAEVSCPLDHKIFLDCLVYSLQHCQHCAIMVVLPPGLLGRATLSADMDACCSKGHTPATLMMLYIGWAEMHSTLICKNACSCAWPSPICHIGLRAC